VSKARKFNMTFAELVDKLTIDQIKEMMLADKAEVYASEIARLEHDIGLYLESTPPTVSGRFIRMAILLAQANLHIWFSKDMMLADPDRYIEHLRFAQDVNAVKNIVKNLLLEITEEATPANKRAAFLSRPNSKRYEELFRSLELEPAT
jgi:hypothetical protein